MAGSEHICSDLLPLLAEVCGSEVQFSKKICRWRGQWLLALCLRNADGMG